MFNSRQILIVLALGHLLLVLTVCARDTFAIVARGYTSLPSMFLPFARQAETITSAALGVRLSTSDPARQTLNLYLRLAGIEVGYGFFAPNVPDNYKVVFQIHFRDGRVEYELPRAGNVAAGLRLSTLIDNIGETRSDGLRELLLKMMAYSIWQQHPDAARIRAVLGYIALPTPAESSSGVKESYQAMRAYDFVFSGEAR